MTQSSQILSNTKITQIEPENVPTLNGNPVMRKGAFKHAEPKVSEFVTSSSIYKERDKEKAKRQSEKFNKFKSSKKVMNMINSLSKYTNCLMYIEGYMKQGATKLPKKYSYLHVMKDLGSIHNSNKLDYVKIKLFEILLTLDVTDRTRLLYYTDDESKILRDLWLYHSEYFKDYMGSWLK